MKADGRCQARIAAAMLATVSVWLEGCVMRASDSGSGPSGQTSCSAPPDRMPAISVAGAFSLRADELACYGEELRVQCPLSHGITAEDRAACELYIKAITTYLSHELGCKTVEPDSPSSVRYKEGGVCLDTFIPGREMEDCYDYLEASIRLVPVSPTSRVSRNPDGWARVSRTIPAAQR